MKLQRWKKSKLGKTWNLYKTPFGDIWLGKLLDWTDEEIKAMQTRVSSERKHYTLNEMLKEVFGEE